MTPGGQYRLSILGGRLLRSLLITPSIKCIPHISPMIQSPENIHQTTFFILVGVGASNFCSCFLGGRRMGTCDLSSWVNTYLLGPYSHRVSTRLLHLFNPWVLTQTLCPQSPWVFTHLLQGRSMSPTLHLIPPGTC